MGGITRRRIEVTSDTCLLGFNGRGYIKSHVFDASSLAPVGGVNELQTVTVTGAPAGGTFTLKYRGQETAAIAFNAAGSAVQTALRALSNIGATGVNVTGAGPYVVEFAGPLAATDVFMLQLGTNSLTGGTNPSVTIAQTTMGVSYDPRLMIGGAGKPGTIVTEVGSAPTKKLREFTGAGSIYGIVDGVEEFISNTPAGDRDVAVYIKYCQFDVRKIKNYATHAAALATWANANFNSLEHG